LCLTISLSVFQLLGRFEVSDIGESVGNVSQGGSIRYDTIEEINVDSKAEYTA